ncbi:hypothetical protein TELCIR_13940 [Teladorsagia circumcincta]|uniref:SCP domain-containing protein n=1 Tax=Teladorsagia circumcincta TaxID=45464 RepID=A0A2G9U419_TELCI|nr:hypothetical protein TELCIR_13940 [Teladorsagia circumcincta]
MLVLITFIYLVLTVASGNAGASCSLNNGMTDEARQMFVDKHNEYRSLVAKGLAANPIGGFAPKAARMLKVFAIKCSYTEANVYYLEKSRGP